MSALTDSSFLCRFTKPTISARPCEYPYSRERCLPGSAVADGDAGPLDRPQEVQVLAAA